jgi:hypothetical protein
MAQPGVDRIGSRHPPIEPKQPSCRQPSHDDGGVMASASEKQLRSGSIEEGREKRLVHAAAPW